ncbi:MAG: CDP-alcohol phosphatidyltransferase family protein [Candidatus Eiseniibacteriota bacterium]
MSGANRSGVARSAGANRNGALARFKEMLRSTAHAVLDPAVGLLMRMGFTANGLTLIGLTLSGAAGYAFFDGHSRLAALLLAVSGLCDILDGQVARRSGGETRFGAFFDSTLDRLSEALVLTGILGFCLRNLVALVQDPVRALAQTDAGLEPITWAMVAVTTALALTGSFLVSYTRARAEGLGLECKVGWFERPERLVLLIVAMGIKQFRAISLALILLALFSFITACQRVVHVWKLTRSPADRAGADPPAGRRSMSREAGDS